MDAVRRGSRGSWVRTRSKSKRSTITVRAMLVNCVASRAQRMSSMRRSFCAPEHAATGSRPPTLTTSTDSILRCE